MPALVAALLLSAGAVSAAEESTAITVYSSAQPGAISPDLYRPVRGEAPRYGGQIPGYAIVRHERDVSLQRGRSSVRFSDVAALIDPTTVRFSSLTDPDGTRVLEQDFQFDLVSTAKLMEKYIDREVVVEQQRGDSIATIEGTLLSVSGGLVLRGADGRIHTLNGYSGVRFPELPGGLITRPTLVWDLQAGKGGAHRTRVAYQTGGITWWADYNLVFKEGRDANSGELDVGAWVSIINQSGASYRDAKLKLIAGDVHRAERPPQPYAMMERMAMATADAKGFEEKAFFEFHLYTLGRPTTLPDNSTKQLELFEPAAGVPARKVLVYYGLQANFGVFPKPLTDRDLSLPMNNKVDVYLQFDNKAGQGLGVPLPAGRIRVSKLDTADDSLEFIGEDIIDHTPRNEQVQIKLGSAFDVVGERRQVDYRIDTAGKWLEEDIEIKLRNQKEQPVEVIVKENLYRWVNWRIVEATHEYSKEDARTVHFPVRVAPEQEATVRFRVRYSW
jgi:hypothetical protein